MRVQMFVWVWRVNFPWWFVSLICFSVYVLECFLLVYECSCCFCILDSLILPSCLFCFFLPASINESVTLKINVCIICDVSPRTFEQADIFTACLLSCWPVVGCLFLLALWFLLFFGTPLFSEAQNYSVPLLSVQSFSILSLLCYLFIS